MPIGLGAAIAGIASGIGSLIQGKLGYKAQERTNQANLEQARFAYRKDLEMWRRNNQYNSPEAQMERLKEAGLNPNLVYGNGAVGNSSGSIPNYQAPKMDYNYVPPIGDMAGSALEQYQNFQIKQAQTDNLEAQNKVIQEEALQKKWNNKFLEETYVPRQEMEWEKYYPMRATKEAELRLKQQQLEQKGQLFESQLSFNQGRVRKQDIDIGKTEKAMMKMDQDIEYQKKVNKWYETKLFTQLGLQALDTVGNFIPTSAASKMAGQAINQRRAAREAERAFERQSQDIRRYGR